jgi:hypothetical protein
MWSLSRTNTGIGLDAGTAKKVYETNNKLGSKKQCHKRDSARKPFYRMPDEKEKEKDRQFIFLQKCFNKKVD